ncbi:MAG: CHASE2 domain-containing protein, partial [Cyanobacteria bacterium J06626_18]
IDSRLLLVTLDEPDISRLRQWPMSDESLAYLLTQITQYQPRAIGLDIYRDFSVSPGRKNLEEVFKNTPNLIGVEKVGNTPVAASPILAKQNQVAMADLVMDDDGTVRRALLAANIESELRWTLGSALALLYLEQEGITLETHPPSGTSRLGTVLFPRLNSNDGGYVNADTTGYQILLDFRGPDDTFETISVSDVLAGKLSEDQVRDRIILIGSIAPSLNDFVYTPYNKSHLTKTTQSPGVAIHAHTVSQIISAVLDGRPLIKTWPTTAEWGWTFLWCLMGSGIIFIPQWHRQNGAVAFISMGLPILFSSASLLTINALFFLNGWWVPSMPALVGLSAATMASLVASGSRLIKDVYTDGLTNILNRRAFNQHLVESQKTDKALAILLCDIDYFKGFNDFYGHPAGDDCLQQVAKSIQQAVRSQDLVARYGGEEFAVILQNVSPEKAHEIAESMRQKVQDCRIPHEASQVSSYVSISCGIAVRLAGNHRPLTEILDLADQALYLSKHAGRNRVSLSEQSDADTAIRQS